MRSLGIVVGAGVVAAMAIARLGAQPAGHVAISIAVDRPGAPIAPTMYGIFFEDINFAADGGIYAEKVKNRSFEFPDPLMGWKRAAVDDQLFWRTLMKASGGMETFPICFIFFLPSFCLSRSFRFRVMSPP